MKRTFVEIYARSLAIVTLAVGAASLAEAQSLALVDLGAGVKAYGINGTGQITGCAEAGAGATHAYIYSAGVVTDLGTFGGANSCGLAINDSGLVTGYADTATASHAFLYKNGALTDLGTVGGVPTSAGVSINATGDVVGYAYPGSPFAPLDPGATYGAAVSVAQTPYGIPTAHAFLYHNGALSDLFPSPPGPYAPYFALAINDSGLIGADFVSVCGILCPTGSALTLSGGVQNQLTDLPGNDGPIFLTVIAGINDSGQIVAYGEDPLAYMHGVIYNNGVPLDLGNNTEAFAIDSNGDVVGFTLSNSRIGTYGKIDNDLMPFLYSKGAKRTLNMPGVIPTGINDNGWIIANHFTLNHAYLLKTSSVSLSPFGLTFGNIVMGQTSGATAECGTCAVTLSNQTGASIAVGGIGTTTYFAQTNNCAASLAPGASCVINVTFTPTSPGTLLGALTLTAGGTQYATVMSGTGTIAATLTSSTSTAIAGVPFTLTWHATTGSACTASGPTTAFSGPVPVSGSKAITESAAASNTYTLSCTQGSESAQAQVTVTIKAAGNGNSGDTTGGGHGGGGWLDLASLALLLGFCTLRGRSRLPCARDRPAD